jgi:hypothetical protein
MTWIVMVVVPAQAGNKPFTVCDSIAWTRVINFSLWGDYLSANPVAGTALFSPSQSHFVLHSRRGELRKNILVDELLDFETKAVEDYLRSPLEQPAPKPRVVAHLEITKESGLMSHIQWLNDSEIGFIAQSQNGENQAFVANVRTALTVQLTHSRLPVASFAGSNNRILYYVHTKPAPEQLVSVVGGKALSEILFPTEAADTPLELYQVLRSSRQARRVHAPRMLLDELFRQIWMSPS